MDKYRRVDRTSREEHTAASSNEIRVTQQGKIRNYMKYATNLLTENEQTSLYLKAMGNAISKTVIVAELLKHQVANLHQITEIGLIETVDCYEPLEEGLDVIEIARKIPMISIQLSLEPLDSAHPGYQSPLPIELLNENPGNGRPRNPRRSKKEDHLQDGDKTGAESSDTERKAELKKGRGGRNARKTKRRGSRNTERSDGREGGDSTGADDKVNKEEQSHGEQEGEHGSDQDESHGRTGGRGRGRGRNNRGRRSGGRGRGRGERRGSSQPAEENQPTETAE
uniref:Aspartyl protease family A01B putative n=1 Tax=Albugo laibachii Nc14 TaxID=890382 RepID=F0WT78_9STRA|nr:aspartyl protease family A01B putative [Albugo laibachii Nc14]|eukprot:CCA24566.1 aspartyl protease family A01B putative [Albugo laibachii Nc14]